MLQLWHRLEAIALTGPLAWRSPYAVGTTLKSQKKKKKKNLTTAYRVAEGVQVRSLALLSGLRNPALLWLWHRLVATALTGSLGTSICCRRGPRKGKKTKKKKKKKKKERKKERKDKKRTDNSKPHTK